MQPEPYSNIPGILFFIFLTLCTFLLLTSNGMPTTKAVDVEEGFEEGVLTH
jgi:hypothetical protein